MSDPISVAVRRGEIVEAAHRVHAVAVDAQGKVIAASGDAELLTFMRSSAKPIQALPLARTGVPLEDREIAIACASHLADPEQLAAVRTLLARAEATENDLVCGPEGEPPSRLNHNCSGNHAGMLVVCREHDWDIRGYGDPGHSVQQALVAEVAATADVPPEQVRTAGDGCGVLTFALSLRRMAFAFTRLESLPGGERVAAAMRAHPGLIRGPESADVRLMRALPGWVAKGGAEALLCAAAPDGLAVALKAEDGASRAVAPGLAAFLRLLGHDLPELASETVFNSRGEPVGEIAAEMP